MNGSPERQHVLIIHPGALGDVLLSLPAIRMIRRAFASHEIVLIAQNSIGRLLQICGEINQVWSIDGSILSALYGGPLALRTSMREVLSRTTHVVGWLSDRENRLTRTFRSLGVWHVQLISPKEVMLRSRHMSERYVETLEAWGKPFTIGRMAFSPLTMHGVRSIEGVCDERDTHTVFIHPGSGSPGKCLPCETLGCLVREVARDPAVRVVICEGPADHDAVGRLLEVVGETPHDILRGKTLEEMSRLMIHADVFLGHDSGLTHLAAAWGVPTVVIFGPTDPDQWRPLGEHVVVQQGPMCRCRTWAQVQECRDHACLTHSVDALQAVINTQLVCVSPMQAYPFPKKRFNEKPSCLSGSRKLC